MAFKMMEVLSISDVEELKLYLGGRKNVISIRQALHK